MRNVNVIIYGSYGYTGSLIVEQCKLKGLRVLLAGRNEQKLRGQSADSGYPYRCVSVEDHPALVKVLQEGDVVIHCGGPFAKTARAMASACIEAGTHYTDITGEFQVFEQLAGFDSLAKGSGIVVMPGTGFDVVPSDCMAVHLRNRLPSATHLELAFTMSKGGLSQGTAKTMVEGMGHGGMIRKNGLLTPVILGDDILEVDFGPFKKKCMCIPWGDISTAWRSTRIPNIQVYSGVSEKVIQSAKVSRWFNWLLRQNWLKAYLKKRIEQRPQGPRAEALENAKSYLWGRAYDHQGKQIEARLETPNGYTLTAKTSVIVAENLAAGNVRPGYATPAQYFGEELILKVEGTKLSFG
jgi:short subunit dehydrogenase-like uncharacterized protein